MHLILESCTNTPFPLAYLLTSCAFQLFFGKLYTFFSIKYVYLAAIFTFEVGSGKNITSTWTPFKCTELSLVICGAAPTSVALIIGRAIAGVGGAGIFSGALVYVLSKSLIPCLDPVSKPEACLGRF